MPYVTMRIAILLCLILFASHAFAKFTPLITPPTSITLPDTGVVIPNRDSITTYAFTTGGNHYSFFVVTGESGSEVLVHKDVQNDADEKVFKITFSGPERINDFCHFVGYTIKDSSTTL